MFYRFLLRSLLAAMMLSAPCASVWAASRLPAEPVIKMQDSADDFAVGCAECLALLLSPLYVFAYTDRLLLHYETIPERTTTYDGVRPGSTLWGLQIGFGHWLELTPSWVITPPTAISGSSTPQPTPGTSLDGTRNSLLVELGMRVSPKAFFEDEYLFDLISPYLGAGAGYNFLGGPYEVTGYLKGGLGLKLGFGRANLELIYRGIFDTASLSLGLSVGFGFPSLEKMAD